MSFAFLIFDRQSRLIKDYVLRGKSPCNFTWWLVGWLVDWYVFLFLLLVSLDESLTGISFIFVPPERVQFLIIAPAPKECLCPLLFYGLPRLKPPPLLIIILIPRVPGEIKIIPVAVHINFILRFADRAARD